MGRKKQPIRVLVASGRSHMSKSEIRERIEGEVTVCSDEISVPEYLDSEQKEKFIEIGRTLYEMNILTVLDSDNLGRYVVSSCLFEKYSEMLKMAIENDDMAKIKEFQNLQNKVFKQAQTTAESLGLTITSRCKLVVPQVEQNDEL